MIPDKELENLSIVGGTQKNIERYNKNLPISHGSHAYADEGKTFGEVVFELEANCAPFRRTLTHLSKLDKKTIWRKDEST